MATITQQQFDKALNEFYYKPQRQALNTLLTSPISGATSGAGLPSVSTVTAAEYKDGPYRRTVLTLTALAQTVANADQFIGTKVYDFPAGPITILGISSSLAQTTTSILADTLNASKTGALALGTATASSTTLATTMANLAPSTAFTSSATINVAGTAVTPILLAPLVLTGTPDMYLNSAYVTDGDIDADATQTWSGTITILWMIQSEVAA